MAVNENIYGLKNQWFNAAFQQAEIENKNKVAYFGENAKTLSGGVTNNKLVYGEPIDKSLSFCGLGSESAMSHVAFFGYKDGARKLLEYNDRQVTNFAFFEKSTATNYTSSTFLNITQLDKNMWVDNIDTSFNNTGDLSPLTLVNPHNIILFAQIEGKADLSHSWTTVGLSSLQSVVSQYGWRYFRRVKITAYFGNVENNVAFSTIAGFSPMPANYKPLQISILDKYVCNEKNTSFYMYGGSINNDNTVFGFPASNDISNDTNLLNLAYVTENAKPHLKIGSNNEGYIEYYDNMFEDIIKSIACFGLYFTGSQTVAANGDLTNENMYIGLLDNDGVGRGRYLQGTATTTAPQSQSNFKDMHDIPYDYKKQDNTKYSNGTNFNLWDFSLNCINKFYVLSESQVEQLSTELYAIMGNISSDTPIERYNQTVFLTQNPIDCIVSIKKFPVDVPHLGTNATIKLGSQTTGITAAHYLSKPCNVYYFSFNESNGTGLFQANGGSFLDYEPYTKVQINVPFCGSFDVPCNYFYEYGGIDIALLIDFVSGACTAFLMVNNNVVDSIQGSCGVDVPLSGLQTATIDSQIFNASMSKQKQDNNFTLSMLGGAAAIALGVATGGAAAVIGGAAALTGGVLNKVANDKTLDYELQHMQAPIKQVSSASAVIGRANDMRCKMIISRPEYIDGYNDVKYAETIGFACLLNGTVSNFSGLTVANINLDGIAATAEEKEMIKNAFASGVYL